MTTLFIGSWYLAGLCGAWLLWRDHVRSFSDDPSLCPTPRAIALAALGALLGLVLFFTGFIALLINGIISLRPTSWWTRPVCKRRDQ